MRKFLGAAFAAASLAIASPAQASHIFVTDVEINGVDLDSLSGPTNPTFNLSVGDTLTLTGDLLGDSDTLFVNLTGFAGSTPNAFSIVFGGGTASFSQAITFNTLGNFSGFVSFDFPSSFPDYIAPNGSQSENQSLAFNVNVVSGAVPEPGTWAMMLLGFGFAGAALRSSRRKQSLATTTA